MRYVTENWFLLIIQVLLPLSVNTKYQKLWIQNYNTTQDITLDYPNHSYELYPLVLFIHSFHIMI